MGAKALETIDWVVARRIKAARERSQLSLGDMGKAIGVKPQTISGWENGRNGVGVSELRAIGRVTGVSVSWLLGEDSPAPIPDVREQLQQRFGDRPELPAVLAVIDLLQHGRRKRTNQAGSTSDSTLSLHWAECVLQPA